MTKSGAPRTRLAAALCALAILACAAVPVTASAAPSSEAMSLVFAAGRTEEVAGNLAVPVRCLGDSRGFCSGVLTLSHEGRRVSIPYSVEGGRGDSIFVPLRLADGRHPLKVEGVAATAQPDGPPVSTAEVLEVG